MEKKIETEMMQDLRAVKKETTLEKHIQTILLSIITVAIIGGFNKISNISESMVRMEERDRSKAEQITLMQQSINKMQSDMNDLKDRVTRFENYKPN